jgi:hypothetical protein
MVITNSISEKPLCFFIASTVFGAHKKAQKAQMKLVKTFALFVPLSGQKTYCLTVAVP